MNNRRKCCCSVPVNPCDCPLTSVQGTWVGTFHCGWACGNICPPFGLPSPYAASVNASPATATLVRQPQFGCPFTGFVDKDSAPLVECATGLEVDYLLRVRTNMSLFWGTPVWPARWVFAVSWNWFCIKISTGAIVDGPAVWCTGFPPPPNANLTFVASNVNAVCPTQTGYTSQQGNWVICPQWQFPTGFTCSQSPPLGVGGIPGLSAFSWGGVAVT